MANGIILNYIDESEKRAHCASDRTRRLMWGRGPPTGGGNTAGDKEDQCANLQWRTRGPGEALLRVSDIASQLSTTLPAPVSTSPLGTPWLAVSPKGCDIAPLL